MSVLLACVFSGHTLSNIPRGTCTLDVLEMNGHINRDSRSGSSIDDD